MKIWMLLLLATLVCFFSMIEDEETSHTYNNKIIRFHVIANSNSEEDQKLKLKVRDEIIRSLNSKLQSSENIMESREILRENIEQIEEIAFKTVLENGYVYPIEAHLGTTWIPEKTYGTLSFPAGEYEALNVMIGEGKGKNWWCVLFPPLCLIDSSNPEDQVNVDEALDMLTKEEYEMIINATDKGEPALKLKFITLEKAKLIKEKIQNIL